MIFMHELMRYMRNLCVFVIQCYKTFDLANVSQDTSRVWSTYLAEHLKSHESTTTPYFSAFAHPSGKEIVKHICTK